MKLREQLLVFAVATAFAAALHGQPYVFTTIAGKAGSIGTNDGIGVAARFHWPEFLIADREGNVYVADTGNNSIRKLTQTEAGWTVSTIAGSPPFPGSSDGTNNNAQFATPRGLLLDEQDDLIVADYGSGLIRKITPIGTNWVVNTLTTAASPWGLARDAGGNLYYNDYVNKVIRKISPDGTNWTPSIISGTEGTFGSDDGTNGAATFASPDGIAVDAFTNLYVGDSWAYTIRKVAPVGTNWVVTTIAGGTRAFGGADGTNDNARFAGPAGIFIDSSGALLVADPFNQAIRKVTSVGPDWITTTVGGLLGLNNSGSANGVGGDARFQRPAGVAIDQNGILYVADTYNSTIRRGEPLRLTIQKLNLPTNQVQVSWPLLATGFVLEARSAVNSGAWTVVSNGISISGDRFILPTNPSSSAAFFRLRK